MKGYDKSLVSSQTVHNQHNRSHHDKNHHVSERRPNASNHCKKFSLWTVRPSQRSRPRGLRGGFGIRRLHRGESPQFQGLAINFSGRNGREICQWNPLVSNYMKTQMSAHDCLKQCRTLLAEFVTIKVDDGLLPTGSPERREIDAIYIALNAVNDAFNSIGDLRPSHRESATKHA